jgi:predicted nucleic acid-binding protein
VVVYEFLNAATYANVFRRPWTSTAASEFLKALFGSSARLLAPGERHVDVLEEVLSEVPGVTGHLFFDTRTAVIMREHGIRRIVTHDGHFRRFPFLEVMDPLE